jgi:hypothetical protein
METVRIRNGKKSYPGSEINIPDPQHWSLEKLNFFIRRIKPAFRGFRGGNASQRGKEGSGGTGREGLVSTEAGSGLRGNSRRGRGGRGAGRGRGGAAVKVQTPGTYDLQVL